MFQRNWKSEELSFFPYDPEYERIQKEKRTSYLLALNQQIRPGKMPCSVEAPLYTDKKYAQPGAG